MNTSVRGPKHRLALSACHPLRYDSFPTMTTPATSGARPRHAPVLVGAVGGSGTRVVARVLARAGLPIGAHRNAFEDSEPLIAFYDTWLRPWLACGGALPAAQLAQAREAFERALTAHLGGASGEASWVVKNPKSILMLDHWLAAFPELRFIHVVRNGLDMAYSTNEHQLSTYQDLVLTPEERALPQPLPAMAHWRSVNLRAAAFGEERLGGRYLVVRFEDLCFEPRATIDRIARFAGASIDPEAALSEVAPPASIGRWRAGAPREVLALLELGRPALERFGYWSEAVREQVESAARLPGWRRLLGQGPRLDRLAAR
jgi:hypothetical protein